MKYDHSEPVVWFTVFSNWQNWLRLTRASSITVCNSSVLLCKWCWSAISSDAERSDYLYPADLVLFTNTQIQTTNRQHRFSAVHVIADESLKNPEQPLVTIRIPNGFKFLSEQVQSPLILPSLDTNRQEACQSVEKWGGSAGWETNERKWNQWWSRWRSAHSKPRIWNEKIAWIDDVN